MTVEYDHGRRVTPFLHEQSALDRAISEFEKRAKTYYRAQRQSVTNETEQERKIREKELKQAMQHLKQERLHALTKINVCYKLDEYQKAARLAADEDADFLEQRAAHDLLEAEKHHPTEKLSNFMRMDGRPQPSPRFTAHHLVQGKGKGQDAARARVELHMHGIGINDPDNGVWMPRTRADRGHWAYPNAAAHSQIHTLNYERWVYVNIQFRSSEQEIRDALVTLRAHLKNGTQPPAVTSKPEPTWDGQ